MPRPRSLYPYHGPDISILPNHRTFLICLDREPGNQSLALAFQPLPVRGLAADSGVEQEAARVRPSAGCDLKREHALGKAFDCCAMARNRAGQDGDGAL
jgi:hypothetical protein